MLLSENKKKEERGVGKQGREGGRRRKKGKMVKKRRKEKRKEGKGEEGKKERRKKRKIMSLMCYLLIEPLINMYTHRHRKKALNLSGS